MFTSVFEKFASLVSCEHIMLVLLLKFSGIKSMIETISNIKEGLYISNLSLKRDERGNLMGTSMAHPGFIPLAHPITPLFGNRIMSRFPSI